jgi:DNA-binding response OmpR family regulator
VRQALRRVEIRAVKTLLVDDDPAFRRLASLALNAAGVEHESVASATEALRLLEEDKDASFDMVLLDHGLPGMTGEELLKILRERGCDIPVVLVTIHDAASDRARALKLGADDYLVKPFDFDELLARVRAVIRRSRGKRPIRLGSLEIDPVMRVVTRAGNPIDLTPREFEILWVLVQAQERTVTRKEFLRRVWNMNFEPGTNFIQVHISRLRTKLGPLDGFRIVTVRKQGYRLASAAGPAPVARELPS